MKYDLRKPCNDCPFRREGGIKLSRARIREIGGGMLNTQGITFACHKTTVTVGDERRETPESQHCAGALIFAEKNGTATQMMRIVERLRIYDARKLDRTAFDEVFDNLKEFLQGGSLPKRRLK